MTDNNPWLGAQPMRREWNAPAELFPKDYSRFVLPQSLPQLLNGTNAHTFRTYDEFMHFIEPSAPAAPTRKRSVMATSRFLLAGICFVLALVVTPIGIAMSGPGVIATGIGFGAASVIFALVALGQQAIYSSAQKRQLPPQQRLVQKFGGDPATALPVFIVDRLAMTAEENDVLDQCIGLYNYCQANSLPLSADHWRSLTQHALAQTRFARNTDQPKALTDLRASIQRLEL